MILGQVGVAKKFENLKLRGIHKFSGFLLQPSQVLHDLQTTLAGVHASAREPFGLAERQVHCLSAFFDQHWVEGQRCSHEAGNRTTLLCLSCVWCLPKEEGLNRQMP